MEFTTNKFRNINGARLLRGLFFEQTNADKTTVVYTLKDHDHMGYPSLKRLYLEAMDPTEYQFATAHLDNYEHWEMLCACDWFKPHLDRWRKELELKIKAEALVRIFTEARNENSASRFGANKFILEKGWEPKDAKGRGRPSKDDIKKAAYEQITTSNQLDEDFERLQLMRVN